MTTASRIIAMLVKDFKVDPDKLTPEARLEDVGIDSIGVAELLFNIEDELGLKLPDVPTDLATFGQVVRYVDEQIAAQGASSTIATQNVGDIQPIS